MKTPLQNFEKPTAIFMMAVSFLALWASLMHPILDGDIWFHLLYGREMLAQKTLILDHAQFSWTPASNDTIYCAWIGQLFYYFLYTCFAEPGIIAFRYLACTIPFLAVAHIAWQRGVLFRVTPWLAATISIFILAIASLDKPELLSLVFMTVLVWNWFQIRQVGSKTLVNVYLFPIVMLIWVNSHGIFIFGCIYLLIIGIGETCHQLIYRRRALPKKIYIHLCIALSLSLVAIFCTPYGLRYIQSIVDVHLNVSEKSNFAVVSAWQETFSFDHPWYYVFANSAVVLILIVLFSSLKKREVGFVVVFTNLIFSYFFTIHARLIYLWVPIFLLTIAYYSNSLYSSKIKRHATCFLSVSFVNIFATLLLFYLLIYHPPTERWPDFGYGDRFTIKEEVDYIEAHYPNARLGNLYDEGAYILWRRWPVQKVMIDARYFPYRYWFSDFRPFSNGESITPFLQKHPFDLAVIPHRNMMLNYWFSKNKEWQPVYYSKGAVLYVPVIQNPESRSLPLQRGQDIAAIKNMQINFWVLNTTLLLRDWEGYDILLQSMRQRFTQSKQRTVIEGVSKLKPAIVAFEQQDFLKSLEFFEEANRLNGGYPQGLAAAALMQSIKDWHDGRYNEAVRRGLRSLLAQESFAATYNLAVMGWQLEVMGFNQGMANIQLIDSEKQVLGEWRKALQQLIDTPDIPRHYQPVVANAKKILAGDERASIFFVPQDWM
ncbi:MAG: hypothetical protein Q4G66_07320 [bacterium]|nr:hypothetical protein [bacterium]